MKLLVLGSKGQVGRELCKNAAAHHVELLALDLDEIDIADRAKVEETVASFKPTHIINAAAYNNVDGAEDEVSEAFLANSIGPANLAIAARAHGAVLVHYSTDYVFDGGKSSPYTEDDPTNPISKYAQSKLLGEQAVLAISDRSYVLRVALVFAPGGNNFISRLLKLADSGRQLKFINDVKSSPTYALDVADTTFELIGRAAPFGLYHAAGSDVCTPYEWAKEVLAKARPNVGVEPVESSSFPTKAQRPKQSVLANTKLLKMGIHVPGWRKRTADYFAS